MTSSVALCTYNGEKFLRKQIDSILQQTHRVDEIIVCDDGSTDQTLNILNNYSLNNPDLFNIHLNEKNLQSLKNFEKAISLCTKDVIFLSDQDDIWIPEKVEKFLKHFKENVDVKAIASNGFIIDDEGETLNLLTIWDGITFLHEKNKNLNYYDILNISGNFATGATMAIKKEFMSFILPFPLIIDFHHDEWIALVAASEKKFDFIDDKTIYYRKHSNQQVGGVFYENTKKRKKKLISFFTPDFTRKTFFNYKFLLKRVSKAYFKNKYLHENADVEKVIFAKNTVFFKNLFVKLKTEMVKKYPIQSFILNKLDQYKNKRQI